PVSVADPDQRRPQTEERQCPQHTLKFSHVGDEDFYDDEADAGERHLAQPIVTPDQPQAEAHARETEPGGGIGVPFSIGAAAPSQLLAPKDVTDFEADPNESERGGKDPCDQS